MAASILSLDDIAPLLPQRHLVARFRATIIELMFAKSKCKKCPMPSVAAQGIGLGRGAEGLTGHLPLHFNRMEMNVNAV